MKNKNLCSITAFDELSTRTRNGLLNAGFSTKEQVLEAWNDGFFYFEYSTGSSIKDIGPKSLCELCEWLGFQFKLKDILKTSTPFKIKKAIKFLNENGYEVIRR